jgi:outer membrane protein OmpA-like peptidoglycan-associated protein
MKTGRILRLVSTLIGAALWVSLAAGPTTALAAGEKTKIEGTITEREGDTLKLRTASGSSLAVKIGAATQIQEKKANPFRRSRKYLAGQLVPGLAVEVEGRGDMTGSVLADKIRFSNDDLKMASTVDTRVTPVEDNARRMGGQIAELDAVSNAARGGAKAAQQSADSAHDRITNLDDFDAVSSISVRFKVGSSVLTPEAKKSLDDVATQAKSRKGYVIEVSGFASSEGNAALNRRLSRQRAQAVTEYLAEQHDIPLRRIMSPTGYGISHPVSDNSTRTGRQENRRAEVRILVSKGMTAAAGTTQPATDNPDQRRPSIPR